MRPLKESSKEAKFLKGFYQYWQEHAGSEEMKLPLKRMLKALWQAATSSIDQTHEWSGRLM
jgi:hypothetical protein